MSFNKSWRDFQPKDEPEPADTEPENSLLAELAAAMVILAMILTAIYCIQWEVL